MLNVLLTKLKSNVPPLNMKEDSAVNRVRPTDKLTEKIDHSDFKT